MSNQVVLRKTLENKNFIRPAVLSANISQIFFSHLDIRWYLLLFFQDSVQLVPSLYHILQQGCQNSNWFLFCWDGVSTRTQIFERKWNWQNMFTQIFLSEIISTAENGGQGTHFLISQILKGLTHCALSGPVSRNWCPATTLGTTFWVWCDLWRFPCWIQFQYHAVYWKFITLWSINLSTL